MMTRKNYANRFAMGLSSFSCDLDVHSSESLWSCLGMSAIVLNMIWTCPLVTNANRKYNMSQLESEEYINPPNYLQNKSKVHLYPSDLEMTLI